MRSRDVAFLIALTALIAACSSTPASTPSDRGWVGKLEAYQKVVYGGEIIGFVKVFTYSQKGYQDSFRLHHVVDRTFREVGTINDGGTGTRYIWLPPDIARVKGTPMEEAPLPARPFADNVATLLGVPGPVEVFPATKTDLVPDTE
jgi:hypothetical protein